MNLLTHSNEQVNWERTYIFVYSWMHNPLHWQRKLEISRLGWGGSWKKPKNQKPSIKNWEKSVLYVYQTELSSLVFLKNFQTKLVASDILATYTLSKKAMKLFIKREVGMFWLLKLLTKYGRTDVARPQVWWIICYSQKCADSPFLCRFSNFSSFLVLQYLGFGKTKKPVPQKNRYSWVSLRYFAVNLTGGQPKMYWWLCCIRVKKSHEIAHICCQTQDQHIQWKTISLRWLCIYSELTPSEIMTSSETQEYWQTTQPNQDMTNRKLNLFSLV